MKEGYAKLIRSIFHLQKTKEDEAKFNDLSLKLFAIHAKHNPVYRDFIGYLNISTRSIDHHTKIPFLPIQFFKHHKVSLFEKKAELIFESSGTTGQIPSKHYVADESIYFRSCLAGFRNSYGNPSDYCILALLPSYLERSHSSLVHMAKMLIRESEHENGGFYLDRLSSLSKLLKKNSDSGQKTLLLGVTFGLLELAEKHPQQLSNCIIMETGGMKGRRREMPREEVHTVLKAAFGIDKIHSEYGMTELLSQAYSHGDGIFSAPPWMKIMLRDMTDPLSPTKRKSGAVNVIDLANIYSCPFIATSDLGEIVGKNQFKILGRTDHSDIRGCNLMLA